ncbi:MAG: ATP-binding protein [ANME-2 cluster archaeon]|nr:ATP-binding protein [ANME-2 cluster archaeon]MBC2700396.1 ATP-binding protein [ANME-2 cluster archaeon]MBC2706593.1 ATP-binding protein [ANME-2 cluster archaeon]MBC2748035.1 ATP-binding protein [ANME-2 cluster archaeon]MBC2762864.1 ATP-binding protein [ANME-2 cluster archaeon]
MTSIGALEQFNPWWKTGNVKDSWLKPYKRHIYSHIEKYTDKRQVILIWGLRRTGKTTIMFQLIQELLTCADKKHIFYFSFDEIVFDFKEILESYQQTVLGNNFDEAEGKIYIFLDEIQKVDDWENKLKVYYDVYPNIKFVVSGSASVSLRRKSTESLTGRLMDFQMKLLSFEEFIEMKGRDTKKIRENPDLWKRELIPLFYRYLKYGMFPELYDENDEDFARKYILNNVIERVIYKDLPDEFAIKDVELLKTLVYIICKKPGMIVNYREIAKDLGKDQRTIANYFEYLEFGLLIKFVFNYRGSPIASMRKMKKVYLYTPNLAFAFNQDIDSILPYMLENIVASHTDARFFYRNSFEIDFIIPDNDKQDIIEVKKSRKSVKQVKKYQEKFGDKVGRSMIVTLEEEGTVDNISVIPAWKFLLDTAFL